MLTIGLCIHITNQTVLFQTSIYPGRHNELVFDGSPPKGYASQTFVLPLSSVKGWFNHVGGLVDKVMYFCLQAVSINLTTSCSDKTHLTPVDQQRNSAIPDRAVSHGYTPFKQSENKVSDVRINQKFCVYFHIKVYFWEEVIGSH